MGRPCNGLLSVDFFFLFRGGGSSDSVRESFLLKMKGVAAATVHGGTTAYVLNESTTALALRLARLLRLLVEKQVIQRTVSSGKRLVHCARHGWMGSTTLCTERQLAFSA